MDESATSEPDPVVTLSRWDGEVTDAAFVGLASDVAAYGHLDALATLRGLSEASGIPVGALARYVLARWASGGSEAALELGASGIDHLVRLVSVAEAEDTDEARLRAYTGMRDVVTWLRAGLDGPR
jgi:hypothetical protein